jgi:hypothetical protein
MAAIGEERLVRIETGSVLLEGNLSLPEGARGIVLFAHGSGSSRFSPRNRHVAKLLNQARLATLLVDLLSSEEEVVDLRTAQLRFNIGLLAERLVGVTDWLVEQPDTRPLRIGYFGASTGAAAALVAAAERPKPLGRLEGIAQCGAEIGVGEFFTRVMRLARDDELVARDGHVDVDVVKIAGVKAAMQQFDRDAAADQMLVEPVELADPVADVGLDRRRRRHVVKDDIERDIHRVLR